MDIRNVFQNFLLVIFIVAIHQGHCFQDEDYEDSPPIGRCPWIRNKLKNGRVRYRYKGRVAKFLCDSGYELAGKRSSTCVRGQWSNPVPVCVARGCSRVPFIPNGRVTEMYRGALLVYDCNPGYILNGDTSIHCDGRRWSTAPPVCEISIPDPETSCDFDTPDLCGWSNDPTHDFDWKRNHFSTPSGHVGTGPSHDHTFGENKAGYYLYIEASSPRKINDTARLFSPVYPSAHSGGCFIFWYHMYGATTGGLRVFLKPESHVFGELSPAWEKFGDQGNAWLRGNIVVPALSENFQIVIEGIRGESYVGDSAIDDVQLTNSDCASMENATVNTEVTIADSCKGRCGEVDTSSSCSCSDNCQAAETCCIDFHNLCSESNETVVQNTDEPLPGDYYGRTTIPATVTVDTLTSLNVTAEQNLTSLSTLSSQVASQASTSSSSTLLVTYTTSASTVAPSSVVPSITTPLIISSTQASTSTSINNMLLTKSSTLQTEPATTLTYFTPSTARTDISKAYTTVSSSTPRTTKKKTTILTTNSIRSISTTESTRKTTARTTTTVKTTDAPKTTKAPVSTAASTSTVPSTSSTTFSTKPSTQSTAFHSTAPDVITEVSFSSSSRSIPPASTYVLTRTSGQTTNTPRYNLRPRSSTTVSTSSKSYTSSNVTSSRVNKESIVSSNTTASSLKNESSSVPVTASSTYQTRRWFNVTLFSTSTVRSTEPKRGTTATTKSMASTSSRTRYATVTTSQNGVETSKYTFKIPKPSPFTLPPSKPTTSDSYETSASKAEATKSNASIPVVIAVVVIAIICAAGGLAYYLRKRRGRRQSKLDDDSEMRFLPESDYMEYSDASALGKILVN